MRAQVIVASGILNPAKGNGLYLFRAIRKLPSVIIARAARPDDCGYDRSRWDSCHIRQERCFFADVDKC